MVELVRGSKVAPSILSGQIVSSGDVQIEGVLEGDLRSHAVTIGEKARVTGEISGELVTVRGFVKGTIRARQVHLCASCHVVGDIYHEALAIETGAHLDGVVRREKDPLANASISLIEEETKSGQLLAG